MAKIHKLALSLFLVAIFCLGGCKLQQAFEGTVSDWQEGEAKVISLIGDPVPIGVIDGSGKFTVPLKDNLLAESEKAIQTYNNGSSNGSFSLNTLEDAFSCSDGGVMVQNGGQKLFSLGIFGGYSIADIEKKKMYGAFMAVNSEDFAVAFASFGELQPVKGYYLDWYFVREAAEVKGECTTKTFTGNQEEFYNESTTYQLDFKEGWNLIKVSADEIYVGNNGKNYISKWSYETIPNIPAGTEFIFIEE
ncbi:hypothetical protein [Luteirhabdus pelagi]|uniref:hypothetical protein n=1 Tax=Luteirhabdus pelagi TaxID=2792783 RepID=UPI001939E56F|nr:hypothetical protein [Luteirhabdus pelagi]